jgi:uncharacterized protein DUF4238
MTAARRTRNQHYVPRLHLRRFLSSAPKNMVWTYDNQTGRVRPSKVGETGNQSNFYSVKLEDGSYVDELDKVLQRIESAAAEPYELLLTGEVPQGQGRADFSQFVASLYARSPALIRSAAKGYGEFLQHWLDLRANTREHFDALMDDLERDTGKPVPDRDEAYEFWQDKSGFYMEVSQKQGLPVLAAADEIAQLLYYREWYLVDAIDAFYITGDSPVFRYLEPDHWHPLTGDGGFANRLCEVTVPLSPSRMLLITGQSFALSHFVIPPEHVWLQNRPRAIAADRFLYAHVKDDRVAQLAMEHQDTPEQFRIEGAGPFAEVKVTR